MSTPTLQFRLAGCDRFAIVDDGPDHVVLRVDADMAPRAALKVEIDALRLKAAAMLRRADFLESALDGRDAGLPH
ncbi:hypothetical protein [Paraburkholderia kururiensis]|uniref:hypothetical protein n=1 Tax=Paraburkholderia kururiensis TaxID=984307 RepID=UPI00034C57E1|nr:hypothetical protein [Paraburkholderia kururiensis]